jgi:hypothetical protein
MTIWRRKPTIYRSSLSIDECIERLTAAIDKESRFLPKVPSVSSTSTISGMINDHKFRLRKQRFYADRSPEVVLHGTLREDQTGTQIETHFDMPPWEKSFWIFWFVMASICSLSSSFGYAFILVGGGAFIALLFIGHFSTRNEKKFLQAFLEKTLNVHRVNADIADSGEQSK